MKKHVLHESELPWKEKRVESISPDRRGLYKNLTIAHGIEQFEARLTRIPPGESNTWYHTHTKIEEWFYVLSGSCYMNFDGDWMELKAGDSIATFPGEWHTFRNFGDDDCEIIMVGMNIDGDEAHRKEEPPPPQ